MESFKKIELDYEKIKKEFQEKDNILVSKNIAKDFEELSKVFIEVFDFLINSFKGEFRRDGKTPLVFHSIFLTKLIYDLGEKSIDNLLVAALHDVLEDTKVTENELKNRSFMRDKENLIGNLKILKENINLSREANGKTLPPRYKEHISRIIGAPKEVINLEIVDRFSDLMDLQYILELPEDEKNLRLKSKIIKVKSFVENIIKDREDFNKDCLELFNYKVKQIEEKYNLDVKAEIIS